MKIFRKSRKASIAEPASALPSNTPRFFQQVAQDDLVEGNEVFSVGAKKPGLFSRIFKRSKDEILHTAVPLELPEDRPSVALTKRKSLWQRSKSILRQRPNLDRSESVVLYDLPRTQINICGSGSSAQLFLNGKSTEELYGKCETDVDTDLILIKILESNKMEYEDLKRRERSKASEISKKEELIAPILSSNTLEDVCDHFRIFDLSEDTSASNKQKEFEQAHVQLIDTGVEDEFRNSLSQNFNFAFESSANDHFKDDLKLDSPLLSDSSFSGQSSASSLGSEVNNLSLEEMAKLFNCHNAAENREVLEDGTVRCLVEVEDDDDYDGGSHESIHFQNWIKDRAYKSDDKLAMTEIKTSTDSNSNLKKRSLSVSAVQLGSQNTNNNNNNSELADRRRSMGAKVSRIVALFEKSFE